MLRCAVSPLRYTRYRTYTDVSCSFTVAQGGSAAAALGGSEGHMDSLVLGRKQAMERSEHSHHLICVMRDSSYRISCYAGQQATEGLVCGCCCRGLCDVWRSLHVARFALRSLPSLEAVLSFSLPTFLTPLLPPLFFSSLYSSLPTAIQPSHAPSLFLLPQGARGQPRHPRPLQRCLRRIGELPGKPDAFLFHLPSPRTLPLPSNPPFTPW